MTNTGDTRADAVSNPLARLLASDAALWSVVALGVILRVVAYALRTEFETDEVAIVRNLMERSLWQALVVPLDFGQAAPKGFLLVEWIVSRLVGPSEHALRLVPFLASVWSLFLVRDVSRRMFHGVGATVTLFFFATSLPFLSYTTDVKQYTLDLALALLLIRQAIDVHSWDFTRRDILRLSVVGALCVWFSQYAVMAMVGLGFALALLAWKRRSLTAAVLVMAPLGIVWGVSAVLAVWVSLHSLTPATKEYLHWYHQGYLGPRSYSRLRDLLWPWRGVETELRLFHGWSMNDAAWTSLFPWLSVVGLAALLARRRGAALLVVAPVLAVLAASAIRQYPQTPRLVLASIAVLLFGIGECAERLSTFQPGKSGAALTALALLLCLPPAVGIVRHPPPYQVDPLGESLRAIRARWQPGDKLYVSEGLALSFNYYASRFGFHPDDYVVSPCGFANRTPMYRAADPLRGQRRVWVVVEDNTASYARYAYLQKLAIQRDSISPVVRGTQNAFDPDIQFGHFTVRLLDLSDPARLASTSAETFRSSSFLPQRRMRDTHFCYGVYAPLVKESEQGR